MKRDDLEKRNIGENLDALMVLDPRGYGVCRILYAGSRAVTGEPLTMHAAEALCRSVGEGDLVYILMGFVLLPHKVPEMDGMVSSMLLARALVLAFGAKPVIVCPQDCVEAVKRCANVVGLHIYEDIATVRELPLSMGVIAFTKDAGQAPAQAEAMIAAGLPAAVISLPQLGERGEDLFAIEGTPPNLFKPVCGDAFAPRNPYALKIDFEYRPPYFTISPTHKARTWLLDPRAPHIERPACLDRIAEMGVYIHE